MQMRMDIVPASSLPQAFSAQVSDMSAAGSGVGESELVPLTCSTMVEGSDLCLPSCAADASLDTGDVSFSSSSGVFVTSSLCLSQENLRQRDSLDLPFTKETSFKTPEQLSGALFPSSPDQSEQIEQMQTEKEEKAGLTPVALGSNISKEYGRERGADQLVVPADGSGRSWCMPASTRVQRAVGMRLTLALDYQLAGAEGSEARQAFEDTVRRDLAKASGLSRHSFRIRRISAGSIVLHMEIAPGPDEEERDAAEVEAELELQAAHADSLLRSGNLTHAITAIERDDGDSWGNSAAAPGDTILGFDDLDTFSAPASVVCFECVECGSPNEVGEGEREGVTPGRSPSALSRQDLPFPKPYPLNPYCL